VKIEKIKKLRNGKYKIQLDNQDSINLHDEVILKNNLLFNKNIDDELYQKLNKDNNYYDSYSKVLKYISYKMRSKLGIEEYLKKLNIPQNESEEIIDKLKEQNLINDELYAKAFITDKINLTNDGPHKIKNELLNKNIDENIIDNILNDYPNTIFNDKIIKLIEKKSNSNNKYSGYILKQKILNNLINMGYSREIIIPNLDLIKIKNPKIIEKEYNVLYRKLSKKYEDEKLYFEIKNRLYKKGFSSEEIEEIIKKGE